MPATIGTPGTVATSGGTGTNECAGEGVGESAASNKARSEKPGLVSIGNGDGLATEIAKAVKSKWTGTAEGNAGGSARTAVAAKVAVDNNKRFRARRGLECGMGFVNGKRFLFACLLPLTACSGKSEGPDHPFRILMDQKPATLDPRLAQDASGQRLGSLLFGALSHLDADLQPVPDLASRWSVSKDGRLWSFWLRPDAKDQAGGRIDAEKMTECLEQYRHGKPTSPIGKEFETWKSVRMGVSKSTGESAPLLIELAEPDPYLPRNLTLLRYFKSSASKVPCSDPKTGEGMVGSGAYRPSLWSLTPETEFDLVAVSPDAAPIRFLFVRDETTRTLKLLRGEADAAQNSLALSKTRWLAREYADRFKVLEREGVNVSYLSFNTSDPILSKPEVRRAIALAIPREEIVKHKMFGFGTVAGSLLSPVLPESYSIDFSYNPLKARQLLDEAGYPAMNGGSRFTLRYKTTPVREGFETSILVREALAAIGIELKLDVVEPAVFLASVRKGAYQLYSSRWIGVGDGSILFRTLHSKQPNNRARYNDPEMDRLLELAMKEVDAPKRIELLKRVQVKMAKDLPYFPLWYWKNALILRKDAAVAPETNADRLSLSGALEPLVGMARMRRSEK